MRVAEFDAILNADDVATVETVEVADTIEDIIEDIIAKELELYDRIGADEFVIYLYNSNYDEDTKRAITEAVNEKFKKDNTPTKGVITKEVWDVPMPSNKAILTNKKVDMQMYSAIKLESNFGGRVANMNSRYIYKAKLWNNQLEVTNEDGTTEIVDLREGKEKLPIIAHKLGMSVSTFRSKLKALMHKDIGLFEIGMNENGEVFYNINYAKDGKYYVTIPSDILEKLVYTANSNMIKLYILLKYHLTEVVRDAEGNFKELKNIRKQMTYDYMMEQIGLSAKTNRKRVLTMLEDLVHKGLIKMYEIKTPITTIDKATNSERVLTVKGYEYELTTYEEWCKHCTITKG